MSESAESARPRQLTTAAGFVIGGSVLLVFAVFDAMGSLQSVDTRDAVTSALDSANGLRMSVDDVLAIMRVGLYVAAVCAVSAAVLGVFVLQRHRAARTVLGVLAVPILLTAPLTGSFLGAVVAAAVAMLWSGQSRDWFAGRPVREAPGFLDRPEQPAPREERTAVARVPEAPAADEGPTLSTGDTSTEPRPTSGYGETRVGASAPVAPAEYPAAPQQPTYQDPRWVTAPAYGYPPAQPPQLQPRVTPTGVRIACLITWVCAVAVSLVCVMALVVASADSELYVSELQRNPALERAGITPDGLLALLWVVGLLMIGWAAGAAVLALLVWRRHDWARYLLVLSSGAVFVASLFAFPVGLPLQAACVVVMVLLMNRPAREWFTGRQGPAPDRPVW